ncbi:MAG: type III polyketide synthase [Rhizobacter sp.]|nr:type III polyketide synthase [Chlorobiales bacterium]
MPKVIAIGTAQPPFVLTQKSVGQFASGLYGETYKGDLSRLTAIFDRTEIDERRFCVPIDWFAAPKTFQEKNDLYITHGLSLSETAIENCLAESQTSYGEIDYLMFVSTTGLSTPAMDARLIERLPFRKNIKRMPLFGLGCAGGAVSLSRAMDIAKAYPGAKILIVIAELCGLTFIRNDLSKAAMISTSLFADGACAVLVTGDAVQAKVSHATPCLVASETHTMPDSLDVMGWNFGGEGFKVILSRDVPEIVKTFMKQSIETFLGAEQLTTDDIAHFITHPGGAKVLRAYETSLGLTAEHLRHAREVLRTCGNMSACTVMFILKRFMRDLARESNVYGLVGALGPGFSSELVLLHWD